MTSNPKIPCARCGYPREARPDSTLCRSCRSTLLLTPEQLDAWEGAA